MIFNQKIVKCWFASQFSDFRANNIKIQFSIFVNIFRSISFEGYHKFKICPKSRLYSPYTKRWFANKLIIRSKLYTGYYHYTDSRHCFHSWIPIFIFFTIWKHFCAKNMVTQLPRVWFVIWYCSFLRKIFLNRTLDLSNHQIEFT